MGHRTIRVFPRKTKASPDDDDARFGSPGLIDQADKVLVSVAFEWDKPRAEELANSWRVVTQDVSVGGPAYGDHGGDFVAGLFLRNGYTITSRGCPNSCWFCVAWRREGGIRELPIVPGHIVQDNNLLACSRRHVKGVFDMLADQREPVVFSGGLDASFLTDWHVEQLLRIRLGRAWIAYDQPHEWEAIVVCAARLKEAGLINKSRKIGCYVLCGWRNHAGGDTVERAERRLESVAKLGLWPMAMLYDNGQEWPDHERKAWRTFARQWASPVIIGSKLKAIAANH